MLRPLLTRVLCVARARALAGCGGDDDSGGRRPQEAAGDRTAPAEAGAPGRLQGRRAARPARRTAASRSRRQPLDAVEDLRRSTLQTSCGDFTIPLDQKTSPNAAASFVSLARNGLLRRHGLPPDRARLRDPGRRPDRQRHGRPRLHDARQAAGGRGLHEGRGRDGQDRGTSRPGTAGSQFYVVTGAGRRPHRPTTPCSGRSRAGMDVVEAIGAARRPRERRRRHAVQSVVIEKATRP